MEQRLSKIPLFKPSMNNEEVNAVTKVLKSGWIGLGPKTEEFEKKFAEYIGVKHAIALNSCTSALHLALKVTGIQRGDEVITTPITFASTSEAVAYNGAIPVYADVESETLNINPKDIVKKITRKTRAILPVHYGGHPCDMDEINSIAAKHNLIVIEDAAHACGAEYKGRKIGNSENMACFSFHAVKNLAMGDGGMITTNNDEIAKRLRRLRWMGIDKSTYDRDHTKYLWDYRIVEQGYKSHMNDLNASIGIVQLKKLDGANKKREEITKAYNKAFKNIRRISPPVIKKDVKKSYHNYSMRVEGVDREELIKHLNERGISAGVHYKPTYLHPRYASLNKHDTPIADSIWKKIVLLPVYPDMKKADIRRVIREVTEFFKKAP